MFLRAVSKVIITVALFLGITGFELREQKDIATNSSQISQIAETSSSVSSSDIPAKAEAPLKDVEAPLEVIEFVLSNKIEGREPKEIVETFSQENGSGMAYAFARLTAKQHTQVTFVWFKEGREHTRFTSNVQVAEKWRTYSSTKLRSGNWKVQLIAGGEVLAERAFTVQ